MTIQELVEKRNKAIAEARKIIDTADARKDGNGMTAEERGIYDRAMADQASLKSDIEARQNLEAAETEMRSSAGRRVPAGDPNQQGSEQRGNAIEVEFRGRKMKFAPGTREHTLAGEQHNTAFRSYLTGETRTAASFANDVSADGGYLHAPIQFNAMLLKFLDNLLFVRQQATVYPVTTSDTLGTPTLATDAADSAWTTEVATISADASLQIGRRDLKPNLLAKLVKVSQKLLRTAALSPEEIVAQRMAYKLAVPAEVAYLTGSGSGQPLGVFTASTNNASTGGIGTNRDVTAGTSTALTADGVMAVKYNLKAQYRKEARWCWSRQAMQAIYQLKDSQNRYLWQPSLIAGQPDTLLGHEVDESEYVPNTFTTGLYVGGLFNWKYYWIADMVTGFEMQRLNELYAANSQVGFIGRMYTDGAPVVDEAFSRAKLA